MSSTSRANGEALVGGAGAVRVPRVRLPPPPAVLIGRERECARLVEQLRNVSAAIVCGVGGVGKSALALQYAAEWTGPVVFRKLVAATPRAELYEEVLRALATP